MTSPTHMTMRRTASVDSALRTHVQKILRAIDATNATEAAAIKKIEDDGHRLVDGGDLGDDRWVIRDWRTDEVIASGTGGFDAYIATIQERDPDDRWFHIDHVLEGDDPWESYDVPPTDGIPSTLSEALVDWVEQGGTTAEEIAEVAAWTAEEVDRCLMTARDRARS